MAAAEHQRDAGPSQCGAARRGVIELITAVAHRRADGETALLHILQAAGLDRRAARGASGIIVLRAVADFRDSKFST